MAELLDLKCVPYSIKFRDLAHEVCLQSIFVKFMHILC